LTIDKILTRQKKKKKEKEKEKEKGKKGKSSTRGLCQTKNKQTNKQTSKPNKHQFF